MPTRTESDLPDTYSRVVVVGRLGARVDTRPLPSGDEVTVFTVVVDRSARDRAAGHARASVDAIACQSFRVGVTRRLAGLSPGDRIQVEGTLHRRFWRAAGGLGSAMEVDVRVLRRVRA